jgi:hypothetical protein
VTVLAADTWNTNADLIADAVVPLGYLRPTDRVLDPTYGLGLWWTRWRPDDLWGTDRNPELSPTVPRGIDFTRMPPSWANHFDAVAFDPPYVSKGGRETSGIRAMDDRYGQHDAAPTPAAAQAVINAGLSECQRVVKPGGIVLVKCQDYVSSGKLYLGSHLTLDHGLTLNLKVRDIFRHVSGVRPQPSKALCRWCGAKIQRRHDGETWCDMNRSTGPSAVCRRPAPFRLHEPGEGLHLQTTARNNYSTLVVFQKAGRR